jgi:hypothetical protein
MKTLLNRSEILMHFDPDVCNLLPLQDVHAVEMFEPIKLLSSERFDVLASYLYAKLHLLGASQAWAWKVLFDVYQACDRDEVFSGKTFNDYQQAFDAFLDGIKVGGFKKRDRYIPVGRNNVLLGDAKRLAAALLFSQPVYAVKFDQELPLLNSDYFQNRGLSQDVADAMMLEYCRLCPNMVVVVVFPIAHGKDGEIHRILQDYGQVVFEKEISFTQLGQYNLISMLYFNMHWIGTDGDITYGVCHHVDHRFLNDNPVKFLFMVCDDISKVLALKTLLRDLFPLKNFSIHINDTHEETLWIAEQLLTPNSIHFLNHAQPWLSLKFFSKFEALKKEIIDQGLDAKAVILGGASTLAVYGLRDSEHLNCLYFKDEKARSDKITTDANHVVLGGTVEAMEDLLYDPRSHFYFRGMKFMALEVLSSLNAIQQGVAGVRDRLLLASVTGASPHIFRFWRTLRFWFKRTRVKVANFKIRDVKNLLPASIYAKAKQIYQTLFHPN